MAGIPERITRIVSDYIDDVHREIPISQAILFGSYAKGTFSQDSDIDIAIISNYFKGMHRVDGIKYLLRKTVRFDADIEPIPFVPEDCIEPSGLLVDVLREGIRFL